MIDGRVQAQLQDGARLAAGVFFHGQKAVDVPGVEHQGLFADGVRVGAESKADVSVMQVIGGADGYVITALPAVGPPQLVDVAVEALEFGKKMGLREIGVDDAHGIAAVKCGHQLISGILNCFHVARGNEARSSDQNWRKPADTPLLFVLRRT
jgi:hypothetical protein